MHVFLVILTECNCFVDSIAFLISKNTTPFHLTFSNHSSHIWTRTVTVECLGRKPDWDFERSL